MKKIILRIFHGLKRRLLFQYLPISFEHYTLYYAVTPMMDQRGIGRVAKALYSELISFSQKSIHKSENPIIFFYASIHFCPHQLPERSVVMIHDVTPLVLAHLFPEHVKKAWSQYQKIVAQAALIITISESSAQDIVRFLGIPRDRIHVIYNGVSLLPCAASVSFQLPSRPYLVFLGSEDVHKNLGIIFQAMKDSRLKEIDLVIIGRVVRYKIEVEKQHLSRRIHFLGALEDAEVGYVIQHALALVFPSLYEGFGLPPLEAGLWGVPSICSRVPAMTEMMKEAALFASPYEVEEWIAAILDLYHQPMMREDYGRRAQACAAQFSWTKSAEKLIESIDTVMRVLYD